jgi:hypothetical protein
MNPRLWNSKPTTWCHVSKFIFFKERSKTAAKERVSLKRCCFEVGEDTPFRVHDAVLF